MGQTPRPLDPSASARDFFGAELRRLRRGADLSQDRLGRLIRFSGDLVRRVETAERFPSRELAEACDRVLGTGGTLGRLWSLLEQERLQRDIPRQIAGSHVARSSQHPDLTETSEMLASTRDMNGSARFPFLPAVLDRVALDWLLDIRPVVERGASTAASVTWVDEGDLEAAATALRMFRELDHAHGAGQVHGGVQAYIESELGRMLGSRPASDAVGTRLNTIAAGFFELCGYQAVDIGADGLAQRRYLRALRLSQRAGDWVYGGYLMAVSLAHLALHCNQPEQALRLAQAAVQGTGDKASPAVRAALHAVLARAHARLGHEQECTSALLTSEVQLARSSPGDEPPWIAYFTPAYLADELAHCFYDLGHHTLAQQQVAEALAGLQPSHVRRLAIDAALLASSLAAAGEVEHACTVGRRAVDHAASTNSGRCAQRIASMRVELEPYRNEPDVRELVDYIRHAVPAAV